MENSIRQFMLDIYGFSPKDVSRMTTGVGGDTFRVKADDNAFVFKIVKADSISHPEREADLCAFLQQNGLPVSQFVPTLDGRLIVSWPDGRISHLQRLIPGKNFAMNTAPEWLMREAPLLLARIHAALAAYPSLPEGIGAGFFTHMTPEYAIHSYRTSLEIARQRRCEDVCNSLTLRISLAEKYRNWRIDPAKLTYVNTHGDYTLNQILCDNNRITGVIDWTSACVHPAVWEITRSYFYAAPECARGGFSTERFDAWMNAYSTVQPLSPADRSSTLDVYLYQLLVCDYYSQFLHAGQHEAAEFLQQADFATSVLRHFLM